jgi:hypothetical protein
MRRPFESVREQLLRAGVAPRHARRYVIELGEHLADLTARERAAGHDAVTAATSARAALGTDAELARAMIEKPGFRSLATRAPWATFGILPVLFIVLLVAAPSMLLMKVLAPYSESLSAMPAGISALSATIMFVGNYLPGPLAAAACILVAVRQRSESVWVWVGLVLIAAFHGLFGLHGGGDRPFAAVHFSLVEIGLRAILLLALASAAYHMTRSRVMMSGVIG